MKRKELVVGTEYVTDSELHVTVVNTEPGWTIVDGQAERDKTTSVRYMSAKKEQSAYQANVNILVDWIRSDGSTVPLALTPRALRATWKQYQSLPKSMRSEMLKYGWEMFSKRREEFEQDTEGREALTLRWKQRLKAAGCKSEVDLSKDGSTVTVPAPTLNKLLSNAGA